MNQRWLVCCFELRTHEMSRLPCLTVFFFAIRFSLSICNTVYIHLKLVARWEFDLVSEAPTSTVWLNTKRILFLASFENFCGPLTGDSTTQSIAPVQKRDAPPSPNLSFSCLFLCFVFAFCYTFSCCFGCLLLFLLLRFLCYFMLFWHPVTFSFCVFSFCSIIVVMILTLCNSEASQQKFEAWWNRLSQVQHGAVPPNICWWRRTDFCHWSRGQLLSVSYPQGKLDTRCIRLLLGMNYTERERERETK